MDEKEFEKKMNAFIFSEHQEFVTYLKTLRLKGLKIQDAEEYVESKVAKISEKEKELQAKLDRWNKLQGK